MCNCSPIPANICNQCAQGNMCGCPPDYTVLPQTVPCPGCCPEGYTWSTSNAAYPDGICVADSRNHMPFGEFTASTCVPCVESFPSDCVIIPAITCLSFSGGTVTQFVNYMCSEQFTLVFLQRIGLSVTLKQAFCQLVSVCPVVGSTTPIIGPITVTLP